MVPAQKQKYRPIEQDRKPRDTHAPMGTLSSTKEAKTYTREKTVSSINGAGKIRHLHGMELERFLTPHTHTHTHTHTTRKKLKCIKDLNVRSETVKLLEENIGRTLFDINHSKIFYDLSSIVILQN